MLQHFNRLQNTDEVMLGDAATGDVHTVLTERDSAWVDVVDDLRWVDRGKSFTWISERDGWRHLYVVSRDGKKQRLVTKGAFDLHNPYSAFGSGLVAGVDSAKGWIYYSASPENATQLYLYRSRLDGKGKPERVTPRDQPGYHLYQISQDGRWALHSYSSFGVPPVVDLVSLPDHRVVRTLVENRKLKAAVARLARGPSGFVKVNADSGLQLDGWIISPPDFDSTKRYPLFYKVYGEPAAQTALDQWAGDYLWHLMLAQQGYVVASVDNRGTPAPRGRALPEGDLPEARDRQRRRPGRRRPHHARLAVGGHQPGCRVGLERRRLDDAEPDVPLPRPLRRRGWRWRRWPTSASTTPFIRSAIWVCRRRVRRSTAWGHP